MLNVPKPQSTTAAGPGMTTSESAELRELKRRNRLLEQENEVLRQAAAYLSQANLPGRWSTRASCSVNTPAGQAGSRQRQVRFDHTSRTGRPKHGASINATRRRPWLAATTPHAGHPVGCSCDSTFTVSRRLSAYYLMCRLEYDLTCRSRQDDHGHLHLR
jgi:hypothetical protein